MLSRHALLRTARTAVSQRAALSQTRAYAAAAASSGKVLPPIALFGVDGTYATALVRPSHPLTSVTPPSALPIPSPTPDAPPPHPVANKDTPTDHG